MREYCASARHSAKRMCRMPIKGRQQPDGRPIAMAALARRVLQGDRQLTANHCYFAPTIAIRTACMRVPPTGESGERASSGVRARKQGFSPSSPRSEATENHREGFQALRAKRITVSSANSVLESSFAPHTAMSARLPWSRPGSRLTSQYVLSMFYVLEATSTGLISRHIAQVNGLDGNRSHHPPC